MATQRQLRIDAFRLYAMFMIVYAHIQFFGELRPTALSSILTLVVGIGMRWTLPFFFITAGYFFNHKLLQKPDQIWAITYAYSRRLAVVFLLWSLIYALWYPAETLSVALNHPVRLLLEGTVEPLWFLPSMVITVWLFALLRGDKNLNRFLLFGGIVYLLGLLGGAYEVTPLGFSLRVNTRNAFFFSTIFFGIGAAFRYRKPRIGLRVAWFLTAAGCILYCIEGWLLHHYSNGPRVEIYDYLFAWIPWGIGTFLIAFEGKETSVDRRIGHYGTLALGMYASHYLFELLLRPLGEVLNQAVWEFLFPALVFTLSLAASQALARSPLAWTIGSRRDILDGITKQKQVHGEESRVTA